MNWSAVPAEALNPKMERQAIHTERMTIARLKIAKGGIVPEHSHENEQVTQVESGLLLFRLPGEEITLGAGGVLILPSRLPHSVEALEETLAIDTFVPRRQDWIDGDDAYLRGGSAATPPGETA